MKLSEFPRYPLTFGPSPVHHLRRLSKHLGGAQVWAKREDVSSGLAYGGNKMRKLEYIVPDILNSDADTLVSIGGYQSNHTRQVAAVAAHLGMRCRLVQERWVPWDDPVNDKVGNILLSRMMGADSRLTDAGFDIGIRDSWKQALHEVEEAGGTPCPIPAGASEHPLGGLGFANWAFEVAEQEKHLGVGPATRSPASHATRRGSSSSHETCATTRSRCSRGGPVTCMAYPWTRRWRRSPSARSWRR